jgi:hypothetical protein
MMRSFKSVKLKPYFSFLFTYVNIFLNKTLLSDLSLLAFSLYKRAIHITIKYLTNGNFLRLPEKNVSTMGNFVIKSNVHKIFGRI